MIIYAVTNGYLDDVQVSDIRKWETEFLQFVDASPSDVGGAIRSRRVLDDETTAALRKAIEDFQAIR